MNKKIILIILAIFLLSTFTNIAFSKNISNLEKETTIYVDDDNIAGPWLGTLNNPYNSITQGIENSEENNNIYVFNGTYYDCFEINWQINLIGENKTNTIINGNYQGTVIQVNAEDVNIQGFTVKNSNGTNSDAGIKINSNNTRISDCIIYRTRMGLYYNNTSGNKIIKCLIHTNGEGIFFDTCKNIEIINCELCHNAIGINFRLCKEFEIFNSYFHEGGVALFFNHSSDITISDSAICDNNNNQPACHIYNSTTFTIQNSNIIHNGAGLRIDNSSDININFCTFRYNGHDAMYMKKEPTKVTFSKCDIYDNLRYGIFIKDGECTISDSNLYNNHIDSIHANGGTINARNNWWGAKIGPWFNGVNIMDRINKDKGRLKLIPWRLCPVNNTGADWNVKNVFTKTEIHGYADDPIELPGNDTDDDGVPDWWESFWGYNPLIPDDHANIDEDEDGLNNFEECYMHDYDSNPFRKDVFLEFDWMETKRDIDHLNMPNGNLILKVQEKWRNHGVELHVDFGLDTGAEHIPYQPRFNYDTLVDLYWDYFLHNDLNNPAKNIFHYGLICDEGSGAGFEFMGWAHCNAFCISSEILKKVYPQYHYEWLIMCGAMHELGHTFGLFSDDFGGNDNRGALKLWQKDFWAYRNYKSIMNYLYTWTNDINYSDGDNGPGDFDDWGNFNYTFFKDTNFNYPTV